MSHVIYVSEGADEYVGAKFTSLFGEDISALPTWISLGSEDAPGEWLSATTLAGSGSTVTVGVLVDSATPLGTYYVWGKISDAQETVIGRRDGTVTLV